MKSSRTSYTVSPATVVEFCQTLFKIAIFSTLNCSYARRPIIFEISYKMYVLQICIVYTTRASIHFLKEVYNKNVFQKYFLQNIHRSFYHYFVDITHYCNLKLKYIKILSEMFRIKWKLKINNKAERTCCKVAKTLTCKMLNCILNFLLWLEDWVALVWWYDVIYNHTALYVCITDAMSP